MISCIHTHTTFCDGKNTPAEMARAAFAAGIKTLGFSGHSYVPAEKFGIAPEKLAAYAAACRALQQEYKGKMEILCGLEVDAQALSFPLKKYDYIIGSLHSVQASNGSYTIVDDTPKALQVGIATNFGGSGRCFAAEYYAQLTAFIKKRRPDVIGHFDLLRKFNEDGTFFDEKSTVYRTAALNALEELSKLDIVFEVNTGAMSRGWQKTPYPADFLLLRLCELGARVTLTTDAHSAQSLCFGENEAKQLIKECGFSEIWNLSAAGWQPEKL